jgi:polyferredoxin
MLEEHNAYIPFYQGPGHFHLHPDDDVVGFRQSQFDKFSEDLDIRHAEENERHEKAAKHNREVWAKEAAQDRLVKIFMMGFFVGFLYTVWQLTQRQYEPRGIFDAQLYFIHVLLYGLVSGTLFVVGGVILSARPKT